MFGGLCFLLNGNMSYGIVGSELMVRVGQAAYSEALALPHAREMDFTGRSMRGMVFVSEEGISEDDDLRDWLQRGIDFAGSLAAEIAYRAPTGAATRSDQSPIDTTNTRPVGEAWEVQVE